MSVLNITRHHLLCLKLRYTGEINASDKIMFENLKKTANMEIKDSFTQISI